MREQPSDARHGLVQRLRHAISLTSPHFRRQALVGPFIVDFTNRKAKLVIELDGGQHDWQQASDALRTRQIEAAGYRILRFWNNDVLGNLEGVLSEIQRALHPPPPPPPPPAGGGGAETKHHHPT